MKKNKSSFIEKLLYKLGLSKIQSNLRKQRNKLSSKRRTKYFCVGANKTGTTSIAKAFRKMNYIVGNQREAELLANDIIKENYKELIKYCENYQVFQDYPFSYAPTYKIVDKAFPNSKFILTVRDSPEQWYQSLIKFHSKIFGRGEKPTIDDLKNANYVYKGWEWEVFRFHYNIHDKSIDIYEKDKMINHYNAYNNEIINYFKYRPDDLLVINLKDSGAFLKFCSFIGAKTKETEFPWMNKTSEI